MREPIEQCAGEPLGAEDLGPFLEGQIGGHHEAVMFIGPTDNLEEQLGSCLGERNVSQFVCVDLRVSLAKEYPLGC